MGETLKAIYNTFNELSDRKCFEERIYEELKNII